MTDLHQHVLWGLDDGPKTPEAMHRMLEKAAADGIGLIAATTHAYPAMQPFDMGLYRQRLLEANAYCAQRALSLRVAEGCEIRYCDAVSDLLRAGRLPTLGGTQHVLIEFSDQASFAQIEQAANRLFGAGYQPVIAHVERIRCLVRAPREAMRLQEECSLLFQVDCSAILQPHGWFQRCFLRRMLKAQAVDLVASDAHDTTHRPICMRQTRKRLIEDVGVDYANALVSFGWQIIRRAAADELNDEAGDDGRHESIASGGVEQ